MIAGLDSSFSRPTAAIAAQARAAGVGLWSGYIATKGGVNLASPWDLASFDIARQVGGAPIAFCSGWDDPVAIRQQAAAWNVRPCLDVELGIRADGSWVQPFLDLSGAGLYGQHYQDTSGTWHSIHLNRTAAFHIMSWYIGRDPGATWAGPQPVDGAPLGWQWQGEHTEFGLDVDRGTYDDWFAQGADMTDLEHAWLQHLTEQYDNYLHPLLTNPGGLLDQFTALQAKVAALSTPTVDVNALAAALATHPFTATLSDAERDAVATHVLQHLSKDTAAG